MMTLVMSQHNDQSVILSWEYVEVLKKQKDFTDLKETGIFILNLGKNNLFEDCGDDK